VHTTGNAATMIADHSEARKPWEDFEGLPVPDPA
jgi:hypothetical protein